MNANPLAPVDTTDGASCCTPASLLSTVYYYSYSATEAPTAPSAGAAFASDDMNAKPEAATG